MPSYFDRGKAECEPLARWTLVGISGRIIGEVILAEEPAIPAKPPSPVITGCAALALRKL